jgi:photosystem II stability/assembly factor-like uncharacterized protein
METLTLSSGKMIIESNSKSVVHDTLLRLCKSAQPVLSTFTGKIMRNSVCSLLILINIHLCFSQADIGWVPIASGTTQYLSKVFFVNADTGFIAGGDWTGTTGTILRTEDGGKTWTEQDIPTNSTINDVFFTDDTTGTAVGYNGTILRTTNGGETWTSQISGTSSILMGVWFTDDTTGFIAGAYTDCLLRTTDAGATWNPQTHPKGPNGLMEVRFANSLNGWAVGYDKTILHTIDGGITWSKQTEVSNWGGGFNLQVFCIDTNTAWITGANGTILHTTNGGETWTNQYSGQLLGNFDIFFTDADTGYLVGGYCEGCMGSGGHGYILHTTNGGETWTTQIDPDTITGFYGVFFTDTKNGIVVGSDGIILRTTNGGIMPTRIEDYSLNETSQNSLLGQNYPNPFSVTTTIKYNVSSTSQIILKAYNISGQEVTTLVNETKKPGNYEATWDAADIPAGVYFYRLETGSYTESRKMVLIK